MCGRGCIETCVSVWPWVYRDMCECVTVGVQQSLSSADTPVSKQKCPYIAGVPSSEGHNF